MFFMCPAATNHQHGWGATGSDQTQSRWEDLRQDEERPGAPRSAACMLHTPSIPVSTSKKHWHAWKCVWLCVVFLFLSAWKFNHVQSSCVHIFGCFCVAGLWSAPEHDPGWRGGDGDDGGDWRGDVWRTLQGKTWISPFYNLISYYWRAAVVVVLAPKRHLDILGFAEITE